MRFELFLAFRIASEKYSGGAHVDIVTGGSGNGKNSNADDQGWPVCDSEWIGHLLARSASEGFFSLALAGAAGWWGNVTNWPAVADDAARGSVTIVEDECGQSCLARGRSGASGRGGPQQIL